MEYNIYMTNDCNLNCAYCSVLLDCQKNGIPIQPTYAPEALATFIERTQRKYHDDEIVLFFFGGEPTLEYGAMARLIGVLQACLGARFTLRFVLHTNGLALHEMPQEIGAALSLVMYSLNFEQMPKHHLAPGYFATVYDNAIEAKEKYPALPLVARVTVTEQTSLYTEVMQAAPFFDMVYWQIMNAPSFADAAAFYATYTFEVGLLFRVFLQELKNGRLLRFVPFMAVLKFLFYHDRDDTYFLCGYDNHMVYVQTDGTCYACCDSVASGIHRIGTLDEGIEFRGLSLTQFACRDCSYRPICMGRCGRMHLEFSAEHIDDYCRMNKYMFELFISRKDELAGILRANPQYEAQLSGWQLDIMEYTP